MKYIKRTSRLCGYETVILDEVERRVEIVGQFELIDRLLGLPSPAWGKTCLRRLHHRGLIEISRIPSGRKPLVIRSKKQ